MSPAEDDWARIVGRETCEECGLRASAVPRPALAAGLRAEAGAWSAILDAEADGEGLRARGSPDVWSPLEYAAHTRDVLALFAARVKLALASDDPELGWWDHEAAAIDERYNDQDPGTVWAALADNAQSLAVLLDDLDEPQWARSGTRRGTERFDIDGLVRFALHETRHHRLDAGGGA